MERAAIQELEGFDDDFFANLEAEMELHNLEAIASKALDNTLTVQSKDTVRQSYQQIRQENEDRLASQQFAQIMERLSDLVVRYADLCAGHDTNDAIFDGGQSDSTSISRSLHGSDDGHDHTTNDHQPSGKNKGRKKKYLNFPLWLLLFHPGLSKT